MTSEIAAREPIPTGTATARIRMAASPQAESFRGFGGFRELRAVAALLFILAAPIATGVVCALSPLSHHESQVAGAERTVDELALLPAQYRSVWQLTADEIWPSIQDSGGARRL